MNIKVDKTVCSRMVYEFNPDGFLNIDIFMDLMAELFQDNWLSLETVKDHAYFLELILFHVKNQADLQIKRTYKMNYKQSQEMFQKLISNFHILSTISSSKLIRREK